MSERKIERTLGAFLETPLGCAMAGNRPGPARSSAAWMVSLAYPGSAGFSFGLFAVIACTGPSLILNCYRKMITTSLPAPYAARREHQQKKQRPRDRPLPPFHPLRLLRGRGPGRGGVTPPSVPFRADATPATDPLPSAWPP